MPAHRPTSPQAIIGILTPQTGGFYYGNALKGILQTARRENSVVIAFETSRLRMMRGGDVMSMNHVDGWLVLNEFDDPALLLELRARGAPIVHLHSKPEGGIGLAVLPDNEGGARAVTEHLIEHGHKRIAFAGNLVHVEMAERLVGYRAALEAAGLPCAPEWVFDTPHHKQVDGRQVARELLKARKAGDPSGTSPTALVAATDRLALGAMDAFLEAGLHLPEDFAIVGFDDSEDAQFAEPPLTTVKQSFSDAASCAFMELLAVIDKKRPATRLLRLPAQAILRASCGCVPSHSKPPRLTRTPDERVRALTSELLAFAGRRGLTTVALTEWPEARTIAEAVEVSAQGAQPVQAVQGKWWDGFLAHAADAESLVRVMDLLESTLLSWSNALDEEHAPWGIMRALRVALMHQWQRLERERVVHYQTVTEAAYRLSNSLSSPDLDPCRDLSWIRWCNAHEACCALWTDRVESSLPMTPAYAAPRTGSKRPIPRSSLTITGQYLDAAPSPEVAGDHSSMSLAEFPPRRILESAYQKGAIVSIAGVPRGRGEEYGLLAVAAPLAFEHLEYVGTPADWGVQLGAALDRVQAERKLRDSAERDELTGLFNRTTLLQEIEELRGAKNSPRFALLFIGLDDFKKVNDSLGHEAGDQLLIQVATRLVREVERYTSEFQKVSPLVARVGGEEFVVAISSENEAAAVSAVEHLQASLKQPYVVHGRTVFLSACMGVNLAAGNKWIAQELLRDADTAMYRAKEQGHSRYEVFHDGMHARAVEKIHLDERLRVAIENNELELWYQPIIDLLTGQDVGAEALIRWRHPTEGVILPGRFLPIAEEVGLSIPISEWTIRRACADAVRWRACAGALYINVNVPAAHIKVPGFVELVQEALSDHGLPPHSLGIEIVESTLLDEPEKCQKALARLRAMGIRVAIDDFGTGYSNLSYLRDFPASTLKIDRSFVMNIPGSGQDNGIVRAMIAMGQELGLSIVAEGIETPEQYHFLQRAGCDYAQGFLMSVPLEPQAYEKRVSENCEPKAPSSVHHLRVSEWPERESG